MQNVRERLQRANWLDTLAGRRSRRFGLGMKIPAGPLAYSSRHPAQPLSVAEESALAFAAAGITGHALADLCFAPGQGGNIMNGFVGRAAGSGDGIQAVALFVLNDQGTWLLRRPRDFAPADLKEIIRLGRAGAFAEVYQRSRVLVKNTRATPSLEPLFNINCNQWSAHAAGTTYFLPVNDLTFLYINGLLEIFNETTGAYVLDERANFRPAGLLPFARSRGGHLHDDPKDGRVVTIQIVERMVTEFVTVEQGMMLQNLALMAQALGLGGFPNFANHEFGWFQALGFRLGTMPASRYLGAPWWVAAGMKLLSRDLPVPYPLGLEVDGQLLLKAYCPPYFASMTEAVRAVVEMKRAAFNQAATSGVWKSGWAGPEAISESSGRAIAATTAYCEYVWKTYGRFPAALASFRTVVGYQACHLDVEFYERYYQPEALTSTQREDFAAVMQSRLGSAPLV